MASHEEVAREIVADKSITSSVYLADKGRYVTEEERIERVAAILDKHATPDSRLRDLIRNHYLPLLESIASSRVGMIGGVEIATMQLSIDQARHRIKDCREALAAQPEARDG